MTATIRKYIPPALLSSLAALLFVVFFTGRDDHGLETFRSESGWGYRVSTHPERVIWQPFIPAIEGNKPFATRKDARRAGKMIIEKLNEGSDPSLTAEELRKAGIRL